MARYINKLALLATIEAAYGVDAVPTGAANAVQATNVTYDVGHEELSRALLRPYMGHQGVILVGKHVLISFDLEIAGPGAENMVPAWATLLRMAGFAEYFVSGDVVYRPRSRGFEAGSLYFNLDGVNHVSLGTRGNVKLSLKPKEIPRFTFEFKGLLGTITDQALPSVNHSGFGRPVEVSKANTTLMLFGYAGPTESLTIDAGGVVEPRLLINSDSMEYVERKATGEVVMDAPALAVKDWWAIAGAHDIGTLAVQHGAVAGNIIKIDASAVQIGMPKYGSSQRIANNALKLFLKPTSAGNDELALTVVGGMPANAWRFADNTPARRAESGFWRRS